MLYQTKISKQKNVLVIVMLYNEKMVNLSGKYNNHKDIKIQREHQNT